MFIICDFSMLVSCKACSSGANTLKYRTTTSCTVSLQVFRASAWHMCVSVNPIKYGCVRCSAEVCKPVASVFSVFSGNGRHAAALSHTHMYRQTDRQYQKPCRVHVHKAACDCRRTRCGWAQHKQNTNSLEPLTVDRADPQNANVYVGNVSPDMSDAEIRQHFGPFGCITDVKIYRKGVCLV